MAQSSQSQHLTEAQFRVVGELAHRIAGIRLGDGKQSLVQARLARRLRALNMTSYEEYLAYLKADATGEELTHLLDVLTTNKTSFFREKQHFDFLRTHVIPEILEGQGPVRWWSAGCSSGEEAYSLGIILCEDVPQPRRASVRILATDISTRMLARAQAAVYDAGTVGNVPPDLLARYFTCEGSTQERVYRVCPEVRALVKFARLNLMEPWPMKGPFDVIFCRNVMIYFDKPTRRGLVERFHRLLRPGGYLFLGHSESLAGTDSDFRYVQPAVYVK